MKAELAIFHLIHSGENHKKTWYAENSVTNSVRLQQLRDHL
jgi:hypothetical protein